MKIRAWKRLSKSEKTCRIHDYGRFCAKMSLYDVSRVQIELVAFNAAVEETIKAIDAGKTHYSMRTIIHFLRHQTAVSDSEITFKINDHLSPKFARVCMVMFDDLPEKFFELRG